MVNQCYCGSNNAFAKCCQPILSGHTKASTPRALMASRYSAYCVKNYAYIHASYSLQRRLKLSIEDLKESDQNVTWCQLRILNEDQSVNEGTVEFSAIYRMNHCFYKMHETSFFIKENDTWVYHDGELHTDCGAISLGRNDSCLCLSGKKYKKCCGR